MLIQDDAHVTCMMLEIYKSYTKSVPYYLANAVMMAVESLIYVCCVARITGADSEGW